MNETVELPINIEMQDLEMHKASSFSNFNLLHVANTYMCNFRLLPKYVLRL